MSVYRSRLFAGLAVLLALWTAPLAAQQLQTKAPTAGAKASVPIHARPSLWVVRDRDTTIYLFGTIHLLRPGLLWFEGPVKSAFDASQEVVLEIADEADVSTQMRIAQRAMDLTGPPLTGKLPEATRPKFAALIKEYRLPATVVDRMKPWFAAITLTSAPLQKLGYDSSQGVEAQLRKYAKAQGKPVSGLETTEEQIGFFDTLSDELQIRLLVETIDEQAEVEDTLARMIDAWSAGDPDRLAATLNKSMEEDKGLEKLLLFDRNERWADWIKARLEKPGTVFLAVGAGHLAGQNSVQDALKARRIKSKLVKPR